MEDLKFIEAETPHEMYKKVHESGGRMLSLRELMLKRSEAVFQATAVILDRDLHEGDPQNIPFQLTQVLRGCPIWEKRYTSSTHMIRRPGGYQFTELDLPPLDHGNIADGGIPYVPMEGGRFLDEATYNKHPGGLYPVSLWVKHPVFCVAVGDDSVRTKYGDNVSILSNESFHSPGRAAIWCPQELPLNSGRAWALGMGADAAYPPNASTRGHWTVVKL